MRANGVESIRAIQAALIEGVAPEIQSEFARNVIQTVQMLLESLAGEWDTAAADLHRDNRTLLAILSESARAIRALPPPNNQLAPFATEIESALSSPADSLAISALSARNNQLRQALERTLVLIDDPAQADLLRLRAAVYEHLRDVATRGWSFWDAASFRERMARERLA